MELPNPFLPGAVSLLEQIDKKLVVVLRDGKTLIGYLRTIDQFANLVLHETLERIHVDNFYGDIPRGIFLIRGENVVLAGEVDEEKPNPLTKVSIEEILRLQSVKVEQRQRFYQAKQQFLRGSGKLGATSGQGSGGDKGRMAADILMDEYMKNFLTYSKAFIAQIFYFNKFCWHQRRLLPTKATRAERIVSVIHLLLPKQTTRPNEWYRKAVSKRWRFQKTQSDICAGATRKRQRNASEFRSAGDLLREERRRKDSKFGELIEQHIREGTIVPVEITCKLIENAMNAHAGYVKGFLVDGFPRNKDNLDGWKREMSDKTDVIFVLVLHAPLEICIQRCLNRGQGRTDDNEESMRKRIITYNEHTLPIIKYYAEQNLVEQVDSTNSPDEVFNDIYAIFDKYGIVPPASL